MPDKPLDQESADKALFTGLVMMLGSSAMQQLGKLVSPASGQAEVDLEGAQVTIDMLTMLKAKTKGNLGKDEERLLGDLLASLQMNYVETAKSGAAQPAAPPADPPAAGPNPQEASPPADAAGKPDAKQPKYRKSYGQ